MQFHLLTQSSFKIKTAQLALEGSGVEVKPVALEIPEIQAADNQTIARHSAVVAARELGHPVAREDHGFYLDAFPGWPGPYMAYAEAQLPPPAVIQLLEGHERTGYFEMALAYAESDGSVWEHSARVPACIAGVLSESAGDFGWDPIIQLQVHEDVLGTYPLEDRVVEFTENFEAWLQQHI